MIFIGHGERNLQWESDSMKLERVRLSQVHLHPANPRLHNQRNIDAIKASLVAYGQQKPIIIDRKNIVIAGNGTVTAARELKWKELLAQRTGLKEFSATAYLIADNRTSELAEWDDPVLAKLLKALGRESRFDPAALGYDPLEIEFLLEKVSSQLPDSAAGKELDERIADDVKLIKCPKCKHEFPL